MPVLTRRAFLKAAAIAMVAGAPMLQNCSRSATSQASPLASSRPSPTPGLRAAAGALVDENGYEVCLTGVNWFGFETSTFAPHGLWARGWQDMLDQIVASGFNLLRLPFCNQVLDERRMPSSIDYAKNPDPHNLTSIEVMDRIVEGAAKRHMRVLLDRHRPTADGQSELWYTAVIPEARWIRDWVSLAHRYHDQPAVIGADLHNEPHGRATWGDGNRSTDWRLAAERAGNAILEVNPNWLIVVEGIERYGNDWYWWGGNLRGARVDPVRLSRPDKLVYSAHDYGPEVYPQPWFRAPEFPSNLTSLWMDHWAGLQSEGVAPVLLGEFGGRSVGGDPEGVWQRTLVAFAKQHRISYAYWSWNPDSGDTGGILKDDWQSVDTAKLELLQTYQCPVREPHI